MAKIPAKKVTSTDPGTFTETIDFQVLHCGNVTGNNNKFYCIELQKNPSTDCYQIFTHYGRIGGTTVFDVRNIYNGGCLDLLNARKEYDRMLKQKQKGKKIKEPGGVRVEKYVAIDVLAPSVGSDNIRRKAIKSTSASISNTPLHDTPQVDKLFRQLIAENVHHITTVTSIKLNNNGMLETPLGPVTKPHLAKARLTLDELNIYLANGALKATDSAVSDLNTAYLSLIPHNFGRQIQQSDWILDGTKLTEEFSLLDQLEAAITTQVSDDSAPSFLEEAGLSFDQITDLDIIQSVSQQINRTRSSAHQNCNDWKVKHVYEMELSCAEKTFTVAEQKFGNTVDLFHGSRNSNILSIMTHGLIVPPVSAAHVTGRMFGDGIYAASSSTKALNYSVGYWGGKANKYPNAFMFIVRFAMGKTYTTTSSRPSGAPKGYHSVHAQAGKSLRNDEYIVYSTPQAKITHLVELSR